MAYDLVVIGASKGGLRALQTVLRELSQRFPLPLAVVLHREKGSSEALAALLQKSTPLVVEEPVDKQEILPGRVYLAPPDYHLLIECGLQIADCGMGNGKSELRNPKSEMERSAMHFALSTDEPIEYARPSVDVLFESAADAFRDRVVGVILTGANQDGARGLAAIQRRGGLAVVQDPETAEAADMPRAALAAADQATVLPLEEIGPFLAEQCRKKAGGKQPISD